MSSSSSSTSTRNRDWGSGSRVRRTWEASDSRCRCGDVARIWTSWTARNPGRKFESCPNFQDPNRNCNYFRWIDPELEIELYRKTLYELHLQIMSSKKEEEAVLELLKKRKLDVILMQRIIIVLVLIIMSLGFFIYRM